MPTYSFMDVNSNVTGPGGSINLGYGSASAEEGITIEKVEAKNKMDIGADGTPQHNLHAGNGATYTYHLLKTSAANRQLMQMYNLQRLSSIAWGINMITVGNAVSGDSMAGSQAAFQGPPTFTYGKDAVVMNWAFDVGISTGYLGDGSSNTTPGT